MTQSEAERELGRIVRETLMRGIERGAEWEIDLGLDLAGIGPVMARIRIGRIDDRR